METSLRPGMPSSSVSFVAPGFLHLLGNVLFTVQGHALTMVEGDASGAAAKAAIEQASARGVAALGAMRALLGEPGQPPQCAGALFATMVELLRIPLRERRLGFRIAGEDGPAASRRVDSQAFCNLLAEAVHHFAEAHPGSDPGVLELALGTNAVGAVTVHLEFEPGAGVLPFPARAAQWAETLGRAAVRCGWRSEVHAIGDGVELAFPEPPPGAWHEA